MSQPGCSELGRRIRAARVRLELSQARLAEMAGVGLRVVQGLEGSELSNPRLSTITSIARVLGLGIDDLFLAGPDLLDLTYQLPAGLRLGRLALLESVLLDQVAGRLDSVDVSRVSVWPWTEPHSLGGDVVTSGSSVLRLRAPSSVVPALVTLTGSRLDLGCGVVLPAPVVTPVTPAQKLRVLVQAPSPAHAKTAVLKATTAAQCCPAIEVGPRRPLGEGRGSAWWARVLGVPARASAILQRIRVPGPEGLFVPA